MHDEIYRKIQKYIEDTKMFQKTAAVLAGVSGGGDSMTMLDVLVRLREEYGFFLQVVHVNHKIRGEEAERDQRLVEKICREKGISCKACVYDVPELAAREKIGLEEAGRKARREAFLLAGEELRKNFDGRVLTALAHNKNDVAETMLHHLARGTGIRGLSSMKAVSKDLIRPLLCLERREIDEYLKERNIPYVLDRTNLEDDYTRNRIRHHILPAMEREINERAVSHMAGTAAMLEQAEEYLARQGKLLLRERETERGDFLFREDFFAGEEILQTYAVREALERLSGQRRDLSLYHIRTVLGMQDRRTGARADLPYGTEAVRTYDGVLLRKKRTEKDPETKEEACWPLPVPGELKCPLGVFRTKVFSYSGEKILEKKYTKWLDCDKIKYGLTVRTRKSGDYLVINREGNRKKLTRCMIDDKIPGESRESVPLLAAGDEVFWIVGERLGESGRITPETRTVLQIEYQGKKSENVQNVRQAPDRRRNRDE